MAGPSGVSLGLRAPRCFGLCGPFHSRVPFLAPSLFPRAAWPVHRGRFPWLLTLPLSGWRTPRPQPVRVCMFVLCFAGSGEPASRARFCAPHVLFCPVSMLSLLHQPPTCWGCPVCVCCWGFFGPCLCLQCVSGVLCFPACVPWALASCGFLPAPPTFLLSSSFLRPCRLRFSFSFRPLPPLVFAPPPPVLFVVFFFLRLPPRLFPVFPFPFFYFGCFFLFLFFCVLRCCIVGCCAGCAVPGWFACPG